MGIVLHVYTSTATITKHIGACMTRAGHTQVVCPTTALKLIGSVVFTVSTIFQGVSESNDRTAAEYCTATLPVHVATTTRVYNL